VLIGRIQSPVGALGRQTQELVAPSGCCLKSGIDARRSESRLEMERTMLNLILVLLVLMWLAGMVTSYTLGGFLHLLLLLAVAVFLIRLIQGRNPVV
jgi:hypothetical protein